MKIFTSVIIGLLFFYSASWRIAHAEIISDHLVISRVQITGGTGKTTNDFVEIFNPTNTDIDLQGMRLVKRTETAVTDTSLKSWTESVIVPAGGYYTWANTNFVDLTPPADTTTSGSLSENNGIAVRKGPSDSGVIIDSLGWGTAANIFVEGSVFPANPTANQILIRNQDTDNNAADFSIFDPNPPSPTPNPEPAPEPEPTPNPEPQPEPTPPPTPQPQPAGGSSSPIYSAAIVISEFMPNPDGNDDGGEWIELYNASESEVDLTGWILDDEGTSIGKSAYKIPDGQKISAQSYLTINLPENVFTLDNSGGDSLRLFWPNQSLAIQVSYDGNAKTDTAYARKADGSFAWTATPTKNTANVFTDDAAAEKPSESNDDNQQVEKFDPLKTRIIISEIFPKPARDSDEDEFIELYNAGEEVDLTGYKISDLSTSYKLSGKILPGQYFIIRKADSNIALNNTGSETVSITNKNGEVISSLTYSDALEDQSYNVLDDGSYVWSSTLTPATDNKITTAVKEIAEKKISKKSTPQVKAESPVVAAATMPLPKLSSPVTNLENHTPESPRLWPWLAGSFAVNLLFCYSLVKLMMRKGST